MINEVKVRENLFVPSNSPVSVSRGSVEPKATQCITDKESLFSDSNCVDGSEDDVLYLAMSLPLQNREGGKSCRPPHQNCLLPQNLLCTKCLSNIKGITMKKN